MKEYAIYKGDDIIAIGSTKQCAKELSVKPETIHFYGTPTYKKRTTDKNGRRLVELDGDEE